MKVVFLLGAQKAGIEDQHLESEIQKEWKHSRDLVRKDFVDSYQVRHILRIDLRTDLRLLQNLTLKTLGGMHWASSHCPQAKWVKQHNNKKKPFEQYHFLGDENRR